MNELLLDWFRDWIEKHEDSKLYYLKNAENQVVFVRDELPSAFGKGPALAASDREHDNRCARITVMGTHRSKSVPLPVYRIEVNDGLSVFARGNFHDWKLSVVSTRPVPPLRHRGLFDPDSDYLLQSVYFEGFPGRLVYTKYADSKRSFSLMLPYRSCFVFAFFRELWLATTDQ